MESSKTALQSYEPLNGPKSKTIHAAFRILPGLALGLTTATSILLLQERLSKNVHTGRFYLWIHNHSVETSIAVNILAQVLAFLQLFVLSTIINHSVRARLRIKAVSLNTLKWLNALVLSRVEWSLPSWMLLSVGVYCGAQFLPAVGWVAALSPNPTTALLDINITVPNYAPDPEGLYWNASWTPWSPATVQYVGHHSVSFNPGAAITNALFNSLATATSNGSEPRIHEKGDGTTYNFVGRSYGVGASIGLANISSPVSSPYSGYTYNETGYRTSVNCIFNRSSVLILEPSQLSEDSSLPNLYTVTDEPSGGTIYAVASFNGNSSVVAFGFGKVAVENIITLTAGTNYSGLDQMQCTPQFSPSTFKISGNMTTNRITVDHIGSGTQIDPSAANGERSQIQQHTMMEIIRLSQRNINPYSSSIGEGFKANIERNINSTWDKASDEFFLSAAAASLEAVIDDMLLSIASAQYLLGPRGSQKVVPAVMTADALVIGTPKGTYGMFAFNLLLLIVWAIECFRTRFWRDTVAWDFLNVEDLVVATSRGGTAISQQLDSLTGNRIFAGKDGRSFWRRMFPADAADMLRVRLATLDRGKDALLRDDDVYLTRLE